jgi:hypothetical protein
MDMSGYIYEVILRDSIEERERKLGRIARYNLFTEKGTDRRRGVQRAGMVLLSFRNMFIR